MLPLRFLRDSGVPVVLEGVEGLGCSIRLTFQLGESASGGRSRLVPIFFCRSGVMWGGPLKRFGGQFGAAGGVEFFRSNWRHETGSSSVSSSRVYSSPGVHGCRLSGFTSTPLGIR